jgi:hypothetical protein
MRREAREESRLKNLGWHLVLIFLIPILVPVHLHILSLQSCSCTCHLHLLPCILTVPASQLGEGEAGLWV